MYTRTITIIVASLLHSLAISMFVRPSGLISSGFTGIAMLSEIMFSNININISTSFVMILLNVPVALICFKAISKNFVILSLLEVILTSIFISIFSFDALVDDMLLNVVFGGLLNGFATVLALRANASTGGTDFIALYVSNKKQKSIFTYVFISNVVMILIFGLISGWYFAGFTIIFQYINNYVIKSFYKRFDRITLQITTSNKEVVVNNYISKFKHGVSVTEVRGGFNNLTYHMLTTVISIQEKDKVVQEIIKSDPKAIINILKSQDFVGGFYIEPIN